MSEISKVRSTALRSPGMGDHSNQPDRARDKVGVFFFAMIWIVVFAYGVYIKTI